jgi:hypothetical protein
MLAEHRRKLLGNLPDLHSRSDYSRDLPSDA